MDLQILRHWDDGPARAAGAAAYELARTAVEAGDLTASLQHLENAILAHPMYADAASQDPAFDTIRGPVQDLVGRVSVLARMRAEASMAEASIAIESAHTSSSAAQAPEARVYLEAAQAHFQLGLYTGYVAADQAAILARRAASTEVVLRAAASLHHAGDDEAPKPVRRALWRVARRLWQKLPLLVMLLGWLAAGILMGLAAVLFPEGSIAGARAFLSPMWAMGLLGLVVFGFVRSVWRSGWPRAT